MLLPFALTAAASEETSARLFRPKLKKKEYIHVNCKIKP